MNWFGKYKELQEEYEDLKQQYNDLDDCYSEIETEGLSFEELKEELKEEAELNIIEKLLKEIKFNTELQDKLYPIFKNYILELANFYCVDIPDKIVNSKLDRGEIDVKITSIIEDYINDTLNL